MIYKLTIMGRLPSLNEFLAAERQTIRGRSGHSPGNDLKRGCEILITNAIRRQLRARIKKPVIMHYQFFERDRRRDLDNISAVGHKYIQDALVKCGILQGDGWKHIKGMTDDFDVDPKYPRIEVEIEEIEQ